MTDRRYHGIDINGLHVTVVTSDESETMTIIQADGSFKEIPYTKRRSGKLTPVPQMPKDFIGWTDKDGVEYE